MDFSAGTQGSELPIPMRTAPASPFAAAGHALPQLHREEAEHGINGNGNEVMSFPVARHLLPPSPAETTEDASSGRKRAAAAVVAAAAIVVGFGAGAGSAPAVRYRQCLKNHAAAMGGNATDGCCEFMPSGEEGSLEALKCAACGCHRNFHRKEVGDDDDDLDAVGYGGRRLIAPAVPPQHHQNGGRGGGLLVADPYAAYAALRSAPPPALQHQQQPLVNAVMPLSAAAMHHQPGGASESDGAGAGGASGSGVRKRFRTKFSADQKARMLAFAERVGWRLQKADDAAVQAFCAEIGVRRRVLKVWMHNNKNNLATKRLVEGPPAAAPAPMPAAVASPPPASPPPSVPLLPMVLPQEQEPSFDLGGPISSPPPLQMVMPPLAPPPSPPFHRSPGSPAPLKLD